VNQTIVIDGVVEVTVLSATIGRIRLGIKAPKEITVNRKEVQERVKEEATG
jgi:carbon storage regulator